MLKETLSKEEIRQLARLIYCAEMDYEDAYQMLLILDPETKRHCKCLTHH
jgi:hypothetical protein